MRQIDDPTASETPKRIRLWDLVKDIRFAMFTSRHANGHLHSRPMTTQNAKVDEDASLWFFMSRRGEPVGDLADDPMVNIVYADPAANSYVSISGSATVVEDAGRKRRLWSKAAAAWFPGGTADADLALVQVQIIHADYWHSDDSRMMKLLHRASAAFSGNAAASPREHARINMG